MKLSLGYAIGILAFLLLHNFFYETKKECKDFDGIEMCRTVHYGNWKEQK